MKASNIVMAVSIVAILMLAYASYEYFSNDREVVSRSKVNVFGNTHSWTQ